jgi:hypothetical protein
MGTADSELLAAVQRSTRYRKERAARFIRERTPFRGGPEHTSARLPGETTRVVGQRGQIDLDFPAKFPTYY